MPVVSICRVVRCQFYAAVDMRHQIGLRYTVVWNKIISIIIGLVIIGALGVLGYVIANPGDEEAFTEFYILNAEGEAGDYPREVGVDEVAEVTVGIVNHEGRIVTYRLEVEIEGLKNNEVKSLTLNDGENWEEIVGFSPDRAGDGQRVEFRLFVDEETEPHLEPLYLWINVTD